MIVEPGRGTAGVDEVDEVPVTRPLLDLGIRQAAGPLALAVGGSSSEHRQARDLDPCRLVIDPCLQLGRFGVCVIAVWAFG